MIQETLKKTKKANIQKRHIMSKGLIDHIFKGKFILTTLIYFEIIHKPLYIVYWEDLETFLYFFVFKSQGIPSL